jgi:DNA-binding transcriptional ArsR family regulator
MSLSLTAKCWDRGPDDATDRYLLVVLSDETGDWGSTVLNVGNLVRKTRLDIVTIRSALRSLEAGGWIELNQQGNGWKDGTYAVLSSRFGFSRGAKREAALSREAAATAIPRGEAG